MLRRNLIKLLTTLPFLPAIKEQPVQTNPDEHWDKHTYDKKGNLLKFEKSNGYWCKRTFDKNGNVLTYESSNGYWFKRTYDKNGNLLKFEKSNGLTQTFNKNGIIFTSESNEL